MKGLTKKELICVDVSVYQNMLTRGKKYMIIAIKKDKSLVRLEDDNKNLHWFPTYCFDESDTNVPIIKGFKIDETTTSDQKQVIEVTVYLSNGESRYCIFVTPAALANSGSFIEGTKIPFHYGNRHIIIAGEVSEELIDRMLTYIDSQGELIECTIPINEKNKQMNL